ncbi:DUF3080 domain-containing protein [Vibrio paucivorans]
MRKLATNIFVLTSLFILSGCDSPSQKIEASFEDYLQRLSNVLEVDAPEPPATTSISLPAKRELMHDIPAITMGLLDSYQLKACGLFHLIAEKNSSLGKVHDKFRNFDYQLNFIDTAYQCLSDESISSEVASELNRVAALKQSQLMLHFENMVFGDDAMRNQLQSSRWLIEEDTWNLGTLLPALTAINKTHILIANTAPVDPINVTQYQESLDKIRLIGELNFSLLRSSQWLERITILLNANDAQVICRQNRDSTKFRYLRNVFNNNYIAQIQPYSALLDGAYLQASPQLTFLTHQSGYEYSLQNNHERFRLAVKAHVDYWQRLFKRCGVPIGASSE